MMRGLAIIAASLLAGSAAAGTLPAGTAACSSSIAMKELTLAAMKSDHDAVDRMIGPGKYCVLTDADHPFEIIEEGPHASQVRVTMPEGDTVDVWVPAWAVSDGAPDA